MADVLPARQDALTALHQVVCRLEEEIVGEPVDADGYYGYHPLPLPEFLAGVPALGEPRGRVLDLGCGLGTKLLLLRWLGWPTLVGVERDPRLTAAAVSLVPEAEIVLDEAERFDCAGFDVVYSYRLCQDLDRQDALGRHILATSDPGTLIFYPGADLPGGSRIGDTSVWRA